MVEIASQVAFTENIAAPGDKILISAGVPFGTPGSTNMLRIAEVVAGGHGK
jgi:pyruvate kinase